MVQNLAWATGYNVIAIHLAAGVLAEMGGLLSPAVGAALMSVSTVIVAVNARMLRIRSWRGEALACRVCRRAPDREASCPMPEHGVCNEHHGDARRCLRQQ